MTVPEAWADDVGASMLAAGAVGVEQFTAAESPPRFSGYEIDVAPPPPLGQATLRIGFAPRVGEKGARERARGALLELGLEASLVGRRRNDDGWSERWRNRCASLTRAW